MDKKNWVKIVAIIALVTIALAMIVADRSSVLVTLLFALPIYHLANSKD